MKKLGYLLFPLLTLGVGALAGYFAAPGIETIYPLLEKSSLTPPDTFSQSSGLCFTS